MNNKTKYLPENVKTMLLIPGYWMGAIIVESFNACRRVGVKSISYAI